MNESSDLARQLLERAQANRLKHIEAGLYSQDEEERVARLELKLPTTQTSTMRRLEEVQAKINQSYEPTGLPEITSHRPAVGRFIVAFKRLLFRVTRPYTFMILSRQAVFNRHVVEILNEMVEAHRRALDGLETLGHDQHLLRDLADQQRRLGAEVSRRLDEVSQRLVRTLRRLDQGVVPGQSAPAAPATAPAEPAEISALDYAALEDRHRGSPEEIRAKQARYVDLFRSAPGPILDLGCGRGEFLALLAEAGLEAYGLDINPEMVGDARARGLRAETGDGLTHLRGLAEESLGGLFMAQVIEHLTPAGLAGLLEAAFRALRPGGVILAETINPQSLSTFAGAFYIDPSHVKPVHPEGARFLWEATGFREVRIIPVNPYPPEARLRPVESRLPGAKTLNENFDRLNELLYAPQDFAVVGIK